MSTPSASCPSSPNQTDAHNIETANAGAKKTLNVAQQSRETHAVAVTKAIDFRKFVKAELLRNIHPDIEISVGGQIFQCRRSLLQLYSGYMRKLSPLRERLELATDEVTPEAMKCICDWMCAKKYDIQRDTLLEVHAAAKFLQIDYLIQQSWNCINSPTVSEDRAFMLYLEAIFFELPAVQAVMISKVQKFFLTLVGFIQFEELPFGHVCEMIASDTLGVNCELEVFFACVRYLSCHWEDRKERVFEMLQNVRFGLLPPHVLVSFRFKKETPEINRMLENALVEKLLSQTMHFAIGLGTPPASSILFKERKWIYDLDCDYHATQSLPGRKRLTYEHFLQYIRFLAKNETSWMNYERAEDVEKAAQLIGRK